GGVDDLPDLRREGEERDHRLPVASPACRDGRVLAAPDPFIERLQLPFGRLGIIGAVDWLQSRGDDLALLPGGKLHRVADQVHDAGLNHGVREDGCNGFWEALQTIDDGDQDVVGATALELVHYAQPELGAFGLFDPHAQHVLVAAGVHADGQVNRLVAHQPFVADLHPQGIEEHDRVGGFQGPGLPGSDLVDHLVGDRRDQIRRDLDAVEL